MKTFLIVAVLFTTWMSASFIAPRRASQEDTIDKKYLTEVWWIGDKKKNPTKTADQFFNPDGVYRVRMTPLTGKWSWKENENTLIVSFSGMTWEQKVLKLTADEFVYEYKGKTYYTSKGKE
jgi:hypothetical protein